MEEKKVKNYKFWFATGSQDLYGEECLEHVAEHSKKIVEHLNQSGLLPYEGVWKPTMLWMLPWALSFRSCTTAKGSFPVLGSLRPTGFRGP